MPRFMNLIRSLSDAQLKRLHLILVLMALRSRRELQDRGILKGQDYPVE